MSSARYQEILKLEKMLNENKIPYQISELFNGWHISYPNTTDIVCSVIEHDGSYGREQDKVEIMGLLTDQEGERDSVCGYLTAIDVYNRIRNHFIREEEQCK